MNGEVIEEGKRRKREKGGGHNVKKKILTFYFRALCPSDVSPNVFQKADATKHCEPGLWTLSYKVNCHSAPLLFFYSFLVCFLWYS